MSSCVFTHTQEDVVKVEKALGLARSELETQLVAVRDTSSATNAAVLRVCMCLCVCVRIRVFVCVCVHLNTVKFKACTVL